MVTYQLFNILRKFPIRARVGAAPGSEKTRAGGSFHHRGFERARALLALHARLDKQRKTLSPKKRRLGQSRSVGA